VITLLESKLTTIRKQCQSGPPIEPPTKQIRKRSSVSNFSKKSRASDKQHYSATVLKKTTTPQLPRKRQAHWISSATPKELLVSATHLIGRLTRFVLQLCAVLSQLNEHEKALEFSKKAAHYAHELSSVTLVLIQQELNTIETQHEFHATQPARRTNSAKSVKQLEPKVSRSR
jgi:hypothetical protein